MVKLRGLGKEGQDSVIIKKPIKESNKAIKEHRHIRNTGTKDKQATLTQDKVMVRWRINKDLFKKIKIISVNSERGINEYVEELLNKGLKGTQAH